MASDETLGWLVDGDPSVVWQVQRDVLEAPERTWRATRDHVATGGWGAQLLSNRSDDGRWAGGLYSPKWISTTYTLLLLWRMGLPGDHPDAVASTELLLDKPIWVYERGGQVGHEDCVAGFGLALSSWFTTADEFREQLVGDILDWQLDDGGWNCRAGDDEPGKHSSFHTTINIVEGLREYCVSGGPRSGDVEAAEARAREFFCAHHLYRSHRTGKIPDERMARLPFPPRWHHDVLRGLDYFRAASAERDPRLEDSIALLQGYQRPDGRWPIHAGYAGKVWFNMESGRNPSRWNTLRALRVMRWWDEQP